MATIQRYLPFASALRTLRLGDYDLIWAERLHIARLFRGYFDRTIVDLDDIEHLCIEKARKIGGPRLRSGAVAEFCHYYLYRRLELEWSQAFAARVVCSELDKKYLEQRGRANVMVVSNSVNESVMSRPAARPARKASGQLRLVFLGNVAHVPNLDAINHFVEDILPLIRAAHPEVVFDVLGPSASEDIRARFASKANFLGYVPDLSTALADYDVLVAPIRFGGGTRVKLLDAMACGIPIVTTAAGAEGLPVVDGEHVLLAEGGADFANKILCLKSDSSLGRRLTTNASELVNRQYRNFAVQQKTAEWLTQVVSSRLASRPLSIRIEKAKVPRSMGEKCFDFSIIIPTYNRPVQLAACLTALADLHYPAGRFEVIVVDDGSVEPVAGVVELFRNRLSISAIKQANAGPAAARNLGVKHARGAWLAFTDDDCLPHPDWLQTLGRHLERHPDWLVGGRTVNGLRENLCSTTSQLIVEVVYRHYNKRPEDARFFATNNLAMSRELFRAMGGFDERFTTAEDRDFCDRCIDRGVQMLYASNSVVCHEHPLSFRTFCGQHFRYGCGAFRFLRGQHQRGAVRDRTSANFHLDVGNWLVYPFTRVQRRQWPGLATLLFSWQAMNLAGFVVEAARSVASERAPRFEA
jgi:GT2 family glycosyltransferase/glycosyltransferase involved in cell wall biosynthesis